VLITTVTGGEPGHRELWAFNLKDGSPAWRRDIVEKKNFYRINLAASAGGVLYLASQNRVMALEAATGTKLWDDYVQPGMDDENWMQIERSYVSDTPSTLKYGEFTWDHRWVIGPDGAFYGTFAPGVFKIR
jgi:glucose dehydrogenase